MKQKIIAGALLILILAATTAVGIHQLLQTGSERETVVIAIPRSGFIRNLDTNYYKLWLEAQTDLSLSFVYLEEGYGAQHLNDAFSSGDVTVDAFFSPTLDDDYLTALALLQDFGENGYILPLNDYLDGTTNLERIFDEFDSYDLRSLLTAPDGGLYFMPGLDVSRGQGVSSIFWLNKNWLSALKLSVPQTTAQLCTVLEAFATQDPNRNGLMDEIPLCGTLDASGQRLYDTIIGSFIYCDPGNSYLLCQNGTVQFAPVSDEWRQAMQYLNDLYADELISPLLFHLSQRSFSELANNPANLLGGFTASHITDVLLQNSPEIISNYIHVAPLEGPNSQRSATAHLALPQVGGVITSSCKNPKAVFQLLDLMLSEEAFLIGRYGEETVDWEPAKSTDMDFYGHKASVRIINHLSNKVQNKHLLELGPFFAYPVYADGISFAGLESDQEYVNARAVQAYEAYLPEESLGTALYTAPNATSLQPLRNQIDNYTHSCIEDFLTGRLDPYDDAVWQRVISQYDSLGLSQLVQGAQMGYDAIHAADSQTSGH